MNFKNIPKLRKWLEPNSPIITTDIPGIKVPTIWGQHNSLEAFQSCLGDGHWLHLQQMFLLGNVSEICGLKTLKGYILQLLHIFLENYKASVEKYQYHEFQTIFIDTDTSTHLYIIYAQADKFSDYSLFIRDRPTV